jgi:hypothetical protein
MKIKIAKGDGDDKVIEALRTAGFLDNMKEIVTPKL